MDTMRERLLSRLAIFAEGKPADDTADAILAIVAEDREKLVRALEQYMREDTSDRVGASETETYKQATAALSTVGK